MSGQIEVRAPGSVRPARKLEGTCAVGASPPTHIFSLTPAAPRLAVRRWSGAHERKVFRLDREGGSGFRRLRRASGRPRDEGDDPRSEEKTSEHQSLMRN